MHFLFTAWWCDAAGEQQEWPAQHGDELGPGWQGHRQSQAPRVAGAGGCQSPGRAHPGQAGLGRGSVSVPAPGSILTASVSAELCAGRLLLLGWSWHWAGTGNSQTSEGVRRGCRACWCTWDLDMYPRAMCFSNYSSQLLEMESGFFLCVFFMLDSTTWGFQWGEKNFLEGHEHKSGSTWQFSCYFKHTWLLQSVIPLCQTVLVTVFSG